MKQIVETFIVTQEACRGYEIVGALLRINARIPKGARLMPSSANPERYKKEVHLYTDERGQHQAMEVAIWEEKRHSGTTLAYSIEYQ
jgi:hypothetical protein